MRFGNLDGRAVIVTGSGAIDVNEASGERFPADPQAVLSDWAAFRSWAERAETGRAAPFDEAALGPPSPRPAQVFGIGLNYREHAAESGLPLPERLAVFTKFPTCISAPHADVELPSGAVDWEVELVVVIGARAYRVSEDRAWSHVAGLCVGQDLSERVVQWSGGGQFSLGKSFPGFGPFGPWMVTPDELAHPDDLALECRVNDEGVQASRTSDMVFPVSKIVSELSAVLPLLAGDVIFTGTPAGIGATRKPPRFLQPGDVLTSEIEGIGRLRNRCVAPR